MKKLLGFIAVLALNFTAHAADGDEFTVDNLTYKVLSEIEHEVSLVGYENEPKGDLIIPSKVTCNSVQYFVTRIGEVAFNGCSSLISVTIPGSVTLIDEGAFELCSGLTSVIIPDSVIKVGEYAFHGCSSLTSVIIPDSVSRIGEYAFRYCSSLTSVIIPDSVIEVGEYAFEDCSNLISVTISGSGTQIQLRAFSGCSSLKTIYSLGTIPPVLESDVFYKVPADATVYIPKGTLERYSATEGWTYFTDFREMGTFDIKLNETALLIEEGNTATLIATVTKDDDVIIKSESWSTSNPEIATVDNGVVTAVSTGKATITFTVVDGYGFTHTEYCEVEVTSASGIEDIEADDCRADIVFYNLNGIRVDRETLAPGLYIKFNGAEATKMLVK